MEVISIPLKGYLRHGDSVQNTKTITYIEIVIFGFRILDSGEYPYLQEFQLFFLAVVILTKVRTKHTTKFYKKERKIMKKVIDRASSRGYFNHSSFSTRKAPKWILSGL